VTRLALPRSFLLVLLLLVLPSACSDGTEPSASASSGSAEVEKTAARPARREPPLPAFEAATLSGERLSLSSLIGKRALLFFFNPSVPSAGVMAEAVARIAGQRNDHNFRVIGIAMSNETGPAQKLLDEHEIDIPTLHDPQARLINQILRRGAPSALILVDAEGYLVKAQLGGGPTGGDDPAGTIAGNLRDWLRLPGEEPIAYGPDDRPPAPLFTAPRLEGDEFFQLAEHKGEPLVLVFFWHTCPHCHEALDTLGESLETMPAEKRPKVVAISVDHKPAAVREAVKEGGWDYLTVVFDPTDEIRESYGTGAVVPVVYMLDEELRIASRTSGWREDRDPPLARMRLAQLAGAKVPMLLHSTGYSGDEFCGVCHSSEHATWELTNHAGAFDTLVRHGEDGNPECVGCHVVGWEEKGGWALDQRSPDLEGVGCETCHGRGGPHLSPGLIVKNDYREVCTTCHNSTHSLGFEYESFLPRVSHATTRALFALPPAERDKALAERRQPRKDLLPSRAAFVGSDACQSCHAKEFETWSGQPHAAALGSLAARDEASNTACLTCHTTGLGKPGGFSLDSSQETDLAAVGCEACHGPGGDHIGEEAPKTGTILSLGDKCDSCVILKICGGCHDDANDPGFEFVVQDKIDAQRHGTTPASASAHAHPPELPGSTAVGLLERALPTGDEAS
jgi:peroxiredoxin